MKVLYKKILDLEIWHDYYLGQPDPPKSPPIGYDISDILTLVPTPECMRVLRNLRWLFRPQPRGASIFAHVEPASDDDFATVLPVNRAERLTFWLVVRDRYFANFTNLPLNAPRHQIYYFSNLSGNQGHALFLTQPLSVYTAKTEYHLGQLVNHDGKTLEALLYQSSASKNPNADDWGILPSSQYVSELDRFPQQGLSRIYTIPKANPGDTFRLTLVDANEQETFAFEVTASKTHTAGDAIAVTVFSTICWGRFAESFGDYVLLNYRMDKVKHETEIIHDKAHFLQDYPSLSRDRFRAFNYCNCKAVWDTENVSGFKKRVSRLLGIEDVRRRNLSHYRIAPGGWIISFSGSSDDIPLKSSQTYYATQEEAQAALENLLLFALHADFYKRLCDRYDDGINKLTSYGYVLTDNEGKVIAESIDRFPTEQEREIALQRWFRNIQVNQNQFKFTVKQSSEGYFFTLKNNTDNQTLLRSLKHYSTAVLAWQSAGEFAEHLRYLSRYVSPVRDQGGNSYSLGIVDQSGNLVAMSATQSNPFETFKLLNSVEPFLRIEAVTERTSGDRFRLVDWKGATLLQGTQLFDNESTASDRFYRDLLGILEPTAIYPTATPDGFGFRVLSRPPDQKSEVAIHPQIYRTAAERDAVINRLFLLIRTARLSINIEQQYNIGQIYGQDEQILLQSKQYYDNIKDAWQHGNILIELAQNTRNFRLITAENGLFGWALTNKGKQPILATQYYSSQAEQKQAIEALQTRINDEGFHVLEHILLRPKTASDNFLPIFVNADDTTTQTGEQKSLTYQDPYSFWITVILPYWTERFRDIDFRRFVERTLRLEAPAHVALKIAWLNVHQMSEFEVAYRDWLEQLALDACDGSTCDLTGTLNRLLAIIPQLRSVYPKGILYDSQASVPENQPIILNQTALGTAND